VQDVDLFRRLLGLLEAEERVERATELTLAVLRTLAALMENNVGTKEYFRSTIVRLSRMDIRAIYVCPHTHTHTQSLKI
jgi:GH24 family phage-related lysozyme (muramidase)